MNLLLNNTTVSSGTAYKPIYIPFTITIEDGTYLNCFANTPIEKKAYGKSYNNLKEDWIRNINLKTNQVLGKELNNIINTIKNSDSDPIAKAMQVIDESKAVWLKTLSQIYFVVGQDVRDRIWNELNKTKQYRSIYEQKDIVDIWAMNVQKYVKKVAGKKIADINTTSRNLIKKQISIGMADGEGNDKIAERIKDLVTPTYRGRAMNIARTETCGAAGLGGQEAAKETGLELEKTWNSSHDSKVRDSHDEADQQTQAMDDPYNVGDSELMFPGDTSLGAKAEEVCYCRCYETYEPIKGG